ncbi:AraC family transcriptional regulator [Paenibacillus montanisoli]|uniref:AraC family transcriptional regulator n=1 Tax=Paenibacillus montanisoli TaxID=2081970 RepID=UPI0014040C7D|nr:AraC family transcriptional regulator [Paenibacillus montanisoli]
MHIYIDSENNERQLPLSLIDVGYQKITENYKHSWPFYQIVCCYQGEGSVTIDNNVYRLSQGSIFYLSPNTEHEYHLDGNPYFLSWVSFNGYLMERLPKDYELPDDCNHAVIQDRFYPRIHMQIMSILEHFDMSYLIERTSVLMYGILIEFFIQYKSRHSASNPINQNHLIDAAIDWMKSNIQTPTDISCLADNLGISRQHLNRLFRSRFNTTTKDFFMKLKILQAEKDLIHYPEIAVKDIALQLGFVNASHFTKVFHKIAGVSPTEHRAKQQIRRTALNK